MKKPIKRVAVIHALCGVGKAAITNIIPVLSVMGVEVCPLPTMLLSTHTGGFGTPEREILTGFIDRCDEHYKRCEIHFEGVLVGYLGDEKEIDSAKEFISKNKQSYTVLDPIFGDNGKCYLGFNMDYVKSMRDLISYSQLITPNYTEACFLTGEEYLEEFSEKQIEVISKKLRLLGAKDIVITSIPSKDSEHIGMAIYEDENLQYIFKDKAGEGYSGTGDIFVSVLIGEKFSGKTLMDSVIGAHNFVSKCIEESNKWDYPRKEGVLLERNLKFLI